MKWLKSTTQKAWTIGGKTIPACVTPHNDYLVLDESAYFKLSETPVIKSLIKSNAIIVLDHEPSELKNSVESLQGSNAELTAKITQLESELKLAREEVQSLKLTKSNDKKVDVEKIKAEAEADKQKALKELDEKASAIIAEKDEYIAKLEEQVKDLEAQLNKKKGGK